MRTIRCLSAISALAALVLAGAALAADGIGAPGRSCRSGVLGVQLDNDILTLTGRDMDYTGGLALLASPGSCSELGAALLRPLEWVDRASGTERGFGKYRLGHRGLQLGTALFTPLDLQATEVIATDRPYANLVYLAASRTRVRTDRPDRALHSSLTLGVLGSTLGQRLHRTAHKLVGDPVPRGYPHEISRGGEPTLRYSLSHHRLLGSAEVPFAGRLEAQRGLHLSVGYLTQLSASFTLRFGAYASPWWRALPDETVFGVNPANAPGPGGRVGQELYGWLSLKANRRLYDSMLQGQWRDSAHRLDADALERFVGEVATGVTWQPQPGLRLSYEMHWSSPELASGATRNLRWAGVTISFGS